MIPYGRHSISWMDTFRVARQLRFGSLTQGPRIASFEQDFAKKVGSKFAVAVSSATSGLHIALLALKLPKDSLVATSPISFVASSNAALYSHLRPLFIDVDSETANLSTESLKKALESNSKISAIIPVHFGGLPCDMQEIANISRPQGIKIVEDAAHALGARYSTGEMVGSCAYSDITVFSLHPVKSITSGEGGVITTNDENIYKNLLRLRSHGINKVDDKFQNAILSNSKYENNLWYYEMQELGYHFRMTEIQAALGQSQLKKLEKFISRRKELIHAYEVLFSENKFFSIFQKTLQGSSSNHLLVIKIDFSNLQKSRNEIMIELRDVGIVTQVHYMPIPLHPYYEKLGYTVENLPNSLDFYYSCLTIPLYPSLTKKKQKYIAKHLLRIIQ